MQPALDHTIAFASSGSFLVQPSTGLTIWTIVVFLLSMVILALGVLVLLEAWRVRGESLPPLEAVDFIAEAASRPRAPGTDHHGPTRGVADGR